MAPLGHQGQPLGQPGPEGHAEWSRGQEESPLTALRLSDSVRMEDFIAKAFQGISIRLMSRLHQGRRLPVVSGVEMPVVPPDEANAPW